MWKFSTKHQMVLCLKTNLLRGRKQNVIIWNEWETKFWVIFAESGIIRFCFVFLELTMFLKWYNAGRSSAGLNSLARNCTLKRCKIDCWKQNDRNLVWRLPDVPYVVSVPYAFVASQNSLYYLKYTFVRSYSRPSLNWMFAELLLIISISFHKIEGSKKGVW